MIHCYYIAVLIFCKLAVQERSPQLPNHNLAGYNVLNDDVNRTENAVITLYITKTAVIHNVTCRVSG